MYIKYLMQTSERDPCIEQVVDRVAKRKLSKQEMQSRIMRVQKEKKINVRDIEDFMFGGLSSRFWILKNFINLQKDTNLPYSMLCWNMISIKLRNSERLIDLIIPSEEQMNLLIMFLLHQIYKTNRSLSQNQNNIIKNCQNKLKQAIMDEEVSDE